MNKENQYLYSKQIYVSTPDGTINKIKKNNFTQGRI